MTIKTTLVAVVLALSPAMAFAGCFSAHQTTASACGEGLVWDAASESCIAPASS